MGIRILNRKIILIIVLLTLSIVNGCIATKSEADELTGNQLWSNHCVRCHNVPSPNAYSDKKWETIAMHMKVRANISNMEINKIKEFLQSANED